MQRYNFQFTGQRFYKITNGRLDGQLRDVAYQATTTDFWNSMEAVGGPQTYVLGGRVQLRQGPAGAGRPGQPRLPGGADARGPGAEHRGGGGMTAGSHGAAGDTVERALAAARCDDCIVIADETSTANLRWAGNTLTTNGVVPVPAADRDRDQPRRGGRLGRRGVPGRACATTRSRTWSGRPSRPPREGSPAEDAAAAARRRPTGAFGTEDARAGPAGTIRWPAPRSGCSAGSPAELGGAFAGRAGRPGGSCTGTPSTPLTSTLPRHLDRAAAAPRPADRQGGAQRQVGRPGPRRPGPGRAPGTSPTSTWPRMDAGLAQRLDWARRTGRAAGRPVRDAAAARAPWPTCSSTCTGRPGPRTRWTGGRVQQAGRRHPGRRAAGQPAGDAAQRPGPARAGLRPVRDRARLAAATPRCSTTAWRWARPTGSGTASWPR